MMIDPRGVLRYRGHTYQRLWREELFLSGRGHGVVWGFCIDQIRVKSPRFHANFAQSPYNGRIPGIDRVNPAPWRNRFQKQECRFGVILCV
jgi:hypothetical protein